mmetsp:Transcript_29376/g.68266  ORF Transcript_29376/g.68266 Transcript_29376/m.68266 type:complete len:111 (-) Transcript_29376:85-417(-)
MQQGNVAAHSELQSQSEVEELVCEKYHHLPLIVPQVQLCEYRELRNSLARNRYGPHSMKLPERAKRLRAEEELLRNTKKGAMPPAESSRKDVSEESEVRTGTEAVGCLQL